MKFAIDQEVGVMAPAEVVWEVLTDLPRYKEWNPFCLECSSTLKPGEPIRMTVKLSSRPQQVEEVMEALVAGSRFAYHMKPVPLGALASQRSHDVKPDGAGQCTYRSHFELRGWLRFLVLALYRQKLESGFAAMTEAVRERAEQLWTGRQRKSA